MSLATLEKRLDAAETQLTPKEWAIRLADAMRKHPSEEEFYRGMMRGTPEDSPVIRPFHALVDQVEERHPGNRPEDFRAKRTLYDKLHTEYDTLKLLLLAVNQNTRVEGRVLGLRALLQLAKLPEPPVSARDVGLAVEMMKLWREQAVSVLGGIFTHQAAVQIIQDRHFNGHAILFQDVGELLTMAVHVMESAVEEFGVCREMTATEAAKAKGERSGKGQEGGGVPALDIEAVRARFDAGEATALAERWFRAAKHAATISGLEDCAQAAYAWQWLREGLRGECLNGVYHAERGA